MGAPGWRLQGPRVHNGIAMHTARFLTSTSPLRLEPDDRLMPIDHPDGFSMFLDRPAPRGDVLYWHYGVTFSEAAFAQSPRPQPPRILHDATLVMVPGSDSTYLTASEFTHLHGQRLREDFRVVARSNYWTLWRRKRT